MKSLIIGSSNNLKKISELLIEKIDDLIFLNSEQFKFSSWAALNRDNVTFYNGEAKEMETLLKAGLEDSDIIIIDTGDDIESLFVAQKCNINLSNAIFIILGDMSISDIFEDLGFLILDSSNLALDKVLKYIEKFE